MRIAVVASAHGYGHATRCVVAAHALSELGHSPTLFSAAPAEVLGGVHPVVPWTVDVGLVQPDSLTEDIPSTLGQLAFRSQPAAIEALAGAFAGFDAAVVDIAPTALEAARLARVPAVAMGNFDWPWIYGHYPALSGAGAALGAWQAPHPAVRLTPGPGLFGFASVEEGGLLGRSAPPVRVAERGVLVCFGGFGLAALEAMLPELPGVTWIFAPPMPRPTRADCVYVSDVAFPSLVAGAEALLTKPGYGIYAEAVMGGTPVVWLDRGAFPEAPFLEAALAARGSERAESTAAGIASALARVWAKPRPLPRPQDDRRQVAERLLRAIR